MPAATKGLVEVVLPALKGLYTELPKTCFGESLKWGVLRIAELSWVASVGSIFILVISLVSGNAGGRIAVTLIGLLLAGAQVTFSSLLFIGACKNEPQYMKPWFWFTVALCVLYMVLATIGIIAAPFLPGTSRSFLVYYISFVFVCAILRYCAQVVYALMQEMQTNPKDRKSIGGASSTKDVNSDSDSGSVQNIDEDVFRNEADVRTLQYVVKMNE